MGAITTDAAWAFRDYEVDGLPSSGEHDPVKNEIRDVFSTVDGEVQNVRALAESGLVWLTQPIRVRSTGNVDIATALENGDTLNGITLATGNYVFLGSQTDAKQNGIYTVPASGAASRSTFADSAAELARVAFLIREGTVGAGERWTLPLDAADITIATTDLNFAQVGLEVDDLLEISGLLAGEWGVKLVEGAGGGLETRVYKSVAYSAAAYTISVVAAAGERRRMNIYSVGSPGPAYNVTFDLAKGTVESATGGTGTITAQGNGEFLCVVSGTATAGSSNLQVRMLSGEGLPPRTGDGVSGLYIKSLVVVQGATTVESTTTFSGWTPQGLTVTADARAFGGLSARVGGLEAAARQARPLLGRKAAWLGSSLVAQNIYTANVATRTGLAIQNLGVSGAALGAGAGNGGTGSEGIYDSIASIETDVDVVIIDAMTNDFAALWVPVGTIADTTTATFYGAIHAAMVAIAARVPGVPVVWIQGVSSDSRFPTNSITATNAIGAKLYQYQQALEEQCRRIGCAMIDLNQANVGYFSSTALRSDGLHWSATGGIVVGGFVSMELERLARSSAI